MYFTNIWEHFCDGALKYSYYPRIAMKTFLNHMHAMHETVGKTFCIPGTGTFQKIANLQTIAFE